MHLQENIFDIRPWVKVIQNVAQYSLHHVTYAHAKFEVATSNVDFPKSVHFVFCLFEN